MNSAKVRRFGQCVGVGLFVGSVFFCSSVSAQKIAESRSLTIYSDVAGASEILAGDHANAINLMLAARSIGETKILLSNNLCVAYTLSQQLELAGVACDRAVYEAEQSRNYGDWFQRRVSFRAKREYKARAFANRSILRTLSGDSIGAARDLDSAIDLDDRYVINENKK